MAESEVALCTSLLGKTQILNRMNSSDLKKECDRLGLIATGKKDEILQRIKTAIEEEYKKTVDGTDNNTRGGSLQNGDDLHGKLIQAKALLAEKDKLLAEKDKRNSNLELIIELMKTQITLLEGKIEKQGKEVVENDKKGNQTSVRDLVCRLESPRAMRKGDRPNKNEDEDRTKKADQEKLLNESRKKASLSEEEERESEGKNKETRDEKYRRLIAKINGSYEEKPVARPRYEAGQVKIFGDSMIRGASKLCEAEGCEVNCYPGIRVKELGKQISCRAQESESEPEVIAIHVGTNNIRKRTQTHLVAELNDLIETTQVQWAKAKWIIGGIVYRENVYDSTIDKLNDAIQWLCEEKGACYYDPNSRLSKHESARDGLHLNQRGSSFLGQLIIEKIEETLAGNTKRPDA